MKQELLSDALNDLDEDLIAETDKLRQRTKSGKKRLIRWGAAAACLCVVLLGAWVPTGFHVSCGTLDPD